MALSTSVDVLDFIIKKTFIEKFRTLVVAFSSKRREATPLELKTSVYRSVIYLTGVPLNPVTVNAISSLRT